MYKEFKSKFMILAEEETTRWRQGGVLMGDYCMIRKDALKNTKINGRPSQFVDKIKEMIASKLPLKVSAVKSERPETQHDLYGVGSLPTAIWVDVVTEAAPGLWTNPLTLPLEAIDIVIPDENNFSPGIPTQWVRRDDTIIKPEEVDTKVDQTEGDDPNRHIVTKHIDNSLGKEAKDGRDQADKPEEYKFKKSRKESFDVSDNELMTEAYEDVLNQQKS